MKITLLLLLLSVAQPNIPGSQVKHSSVTVLDQYGDTLSVERFVGV